jgi:hypothetical protein
MKPLGRKRTDAADMLAISTAAVHPIDPLIVKSSPALSFAYALMCLAFVAIGVLMVTFAKDSSAVWFGWMGVAVFGVFFASALRFTLDRRPRLILDENGLFDRRLGLGIIRWEDIEGAFLGSYARVDFIGLSLRNEDEYRRRLLIVRRLLYSANRPLGFPYFLVNLGAIEVASEEILESIMERCAASRQRYEHDYLPR